MVTASLWPPRTGRPVTIAVAGTHSTGKSTFLAQLAQQLRDQKLRVATVGGLGDTARTAGLPVLTGHTFESTLWIITRGIGEELAARINVDVVLVDRPVADALGYYRAALAFRGERPEPFQHAALFTFVQLHSTIGYDLIFCTNLDPALPLGVNKHRDNDLRFRELADHHVHQVLKQLSISTKALTIQGHSAALREAMAFTTAALTTKSRG